jgi:hypothetical protein
MFFQPQLFDVLSNSPWEYGIFKLENFVSLTVDLLRQISPVKNCCCSNILRPENNYTIANAAGFVADMGLL